MDQNDALAQLKTLAQPAQTDPDAAVQTEAVALMCMDCGERGLSPEAWRAHHCPPGKCDAMGCNDPRHTTPDPDAAVRAIARAEAESIATRWVPAHMTARQGMVDDITASLVRYRALGREDAK
jgi:hypothetical protein